LSRIEPRLLEHERQLIQYDDAVKILDDAMKTLEHLMEKMTVLIDVLTSDWIAMDAVLEDIYGRVEILRNNQLLQLKLKGLRRDWTRIGGEYLEYKNEVRITI
jgi:hypothetical protein